MSKRKKIKRSVGDNNPDPLTEKMQTILQQQKAPGGRGVLLIAGGHPFYGQMAANLAASLKLSDSNIKIHLAYHGNALNHLDEAKKQLFSSVALIPEEYLQHNGKLSYFKAKTFLYELSPFDETLFLDVDMMWLTSHLVSAVFEELKSTDFTISNRERFDITEPSCEYLWADMNEIRAEYGFSKGFIYGLHSEFIYFKKNERMKAYFDTVKKVYDNPRVKTTSIAGTVPDEIAFAIASVIHDIYPHKYPYVPVYWYLTDATKGTSLNYVTTNYMAYSIGGNATPEVVRNRYNLLAKSHAGRLSLLRPWTAIPKRRWLPERVKL